MTIENKDGQSEYIFDEYPAFNDLHVRLLAKGFDVISTHYYAEDYYQFSYKMYDELFANKVDIYYRIYSQEVDILINALHICYRYSIDDVLEMGFME